MQYEWQNIEYKFTRNEPKNILEEAQTAAQLMGITSDETALSVLSIVSDVATEMDRKDKEEIGRPITDAELTFLTQGRDVNESDAD